MDPSPHPGPGSQGAPPGTALSRSHSSSYPYDEILDRLRSFTNLRVVRDEGAETGYRVEAGPFPGWETVPEW
jgi:hypothetical protein